MAHSDSKSAIGSSPDELAISLGNWAYDHQDFMRHNPLGYNAYQYARSAIASIPYGLGAAAAFMALRKIAPEAGRSVDKWESGLKAALQIGASFTFYRAFSKSGKWTFDDIFNPDNSRDDTIKAVQHAPKTFMDGLKLQVPAEAASVPWGALTLGYITQLHKPMGAAAQAAAKTNWQALLTHPENSILQNCAVNTVAYSTFFEVSDRLAENYKRRHGQWDASEDKPADQHSFFTQGLGRKVFRDVLPVAAGISLYTGAKRMGYRWAGGTMSMEKGLLTNAWREGFATSLFFTLLSCTEPWGKMYDRFFEELGQKGKDTPPMPENVTIKENQGRVAPELTPERVA